MKDKIKEIIYNHVISADVLVMGKLEHDLLAAFREYVESKKPRPLMGKHGKEKQEWIDAALGIYEESLLSGLTEEKE